MDIEDVIKEVEFNLSTIGLSEKSTMLVDLAERC